MPTVHSGSNIETTRGFDKKVQRPPHLTEKEEIFENVTESSALSPGAFWRTRGGPEEEEEASPQEEKTPANLKGSRFGVNLGNTLKNGEQQ